MELNIPILKTPQELEQAIQRYRAGDWNSHSLFALWQAIRTASVAQVAPEAQNSDRVPGEDSY
jgi:hypothetical protein